MVARLSAIFLLTLVLAGTARAKWAVTASQTEQGSAAGIEHRRIELSDSGTGERATLDLALPGSRGVRVAPSSIVQARDRLGDEPLRWLFERTAETWAHQSARRHAWRGLAVYGADGTTVRVEVPCRS